MTALVDDSRSAAEKRGFGKEAMECTGTAANANANSDAPREFARKMGPPTLKQKVANAALRRNLLANANGSANEIARKFHPGWQEIPCEWKLATKFASDCECDGVVHCRKGPLRNLGPLALFKSPSGGGLTKMGSVTF